MHATRRLCSSQRAGQLVSRSGFGGALVRRCVHTSPMDATGHEVTLYTKLDCPLCHKAKAILQRVQAQVPFELKEVDILKCDEETLNRYCFHIPVVHLNGAEVFRHRVDEDEMLKLVRQPPPSH